MVYTFTLASVHRLEWLCHNHCVVFIECLYCYAIMHIRIQYKIFLYIHLHISMRAQIRNDLSQPLCCSCRMSVWLCWHAYNIRKCYIYFILVRTYIMWYHHHTLQDVVNEPKASDAIAKSVDSSKNRYLNTHTCEMSCAYVIILYICISRHIS